MWGWEDGRRALTLRNEPRDLQHFRMGCHGNAGSCAWSFESCVISYVSVLWLTTSESQTTAGNWILARLRAPCPGLNSPVCKMNTQYLADRETPSEIKKILRAWSRLMKLWLLVYFVVVVVSVLVQLKYDGQELAQTYSSFSHILCWQRKTQISCKHFDSHRQLN